MISKSKRAKTENENNPLLLLLTARYNSLRRQAVKRWMIIASIHDKSYQGTVLYSSLNIEEHFSLFAELPTMQQAAKNLVSQANYFQQSTFEFQQRDEKPFSDCMNASSPVKVKVIAQEVSFGTPKKSTGIDVSFADIMTEYTKLCIDQGKIIEQGINEQLLSCQNALNLHKRGGDTYNELLDLKQKFSNLLGDMTNLTFKSEYQRDFIDLLNQTSVDLSQFLRKGNLDKHDVVVRDQRILLRLLLQTLHIKSLSTLWFYGMGINKLYRTQLDYQRLQELVALNKLSLLSKDDKKKNVARELETIKELAGNYSQFNVDSVDRISLFTLATENIATLKAIAPHCGQIESSVIKQLLADFQCERDILFCELAIAEMPRSKYSDRPFGKLNDTSIWCQAMTTLLQKHNDASLSAHTTTRLTALKQRLADVAKAIIIELGDIASQCDNHFHDIQQWFAQYSLAKAPQHFLNRAAISALMAKSIPLFSSLASYADNTLLYSRRISEQHQQILLWRRQLHDKLCYVDIDIWYNNVQQAAFSQYTNDEQTFQNILYLQSIPESKPKFCNQLLLLASVFSDEKDKYLGLYNKINALSYYHEKMVEMAGWFLHDVTQQVKRITPLHTLFINYLKGDNHHHRVAMSAHQSVLVLIDSANAKRNFIATMNIASDRVGRIDEAIEDVIAQYESSMPLYSCLAHVSVTAKPINQTLISMIQDLAHITGQTTQLVDRHVQLAFESFDDGDIYDNHNLFASIRNHLDHYAGFCIQYFECNIERMTDRETDSIRASLFTYCSETKSDLQRMIDFLTATLNEYDKHHNPGLFPRII